MTYIKSGRWFICALGLGLTGPRCGAMCSNEEALRAHQRNMTHNSLGAI